MLESVIVFPQSVAKHVLNKTLSVLLAIQILLCALSPGFTPAILGAFVLMIAAPIAFLKSMPVRGAALLLVPFIVGVIVLQGGVFAPVILGWFVLIAIAAVICWNRGPIKPTCYRISG